MGKKKGGKYRVGSGLQRQRKVNKLIRRLKMKVARWKRYKAEGKPCGGEVPRGRKISKKRSPSTLTRHDNWNTEKLEKYIEFLENLPCKSKKRQFIDHR